VRRAAKVVVIESGKVHGEGPHEDLIARDDLYRRLCELQLITAGLTDSAKGAG
jgi:ABC-type multidrug transport system fused ATPase/permease subunit